MKNNYKFYQSINDQNNFAPDGDFILKNESYDDIQIIPCEYCEGVMMQNVVFFGGRVSNSIKEKSFKAILSAKSILVLGSTLQVYSSFRLAKLAHKHKIPISIITLGETRVDPLCQIKLDKDLIKAIVPIHKALL